MICLSNQRLCIWQLTTNQQFENHKHVVHFSLRFSFWLLGACKTLWNLKFGLLSDRRTLYNRALWIRFRLRCFTGQHLATRNPRILQTLCKLSSLHDGRLDNLQPTSRLRNSAPMWLSTLFSNSNCHNFVLVRFAQQLRLLCSLDFRLWSSEFYRKPFIL